MTRVQSSAGHDSHLRELVDLDGTPIARFTAGRRDGLPLAEQLEPIGGATAEQVAHAALRELPGHLVATSLDVGRALVAAGARPRRHAHVLRRSLAHPLPAPARVPGLRLVPVAGMPAEALVPAMMAAYPPGHPDHEPGDDDPAFVRRRIELLLTGEEVGPLLAASRVALEAAGTVAGAALLTRSPDAPPWGGPWVAELFRDPAHRGAGRALLRAALTAAADAGADAIGLAVTDGNPARALYEQEGFRLVATALTVVVPGGPDGS